MTPPPVKTTNAVAVPASSEVLDNAHKAELRAQHAERRFATGGSARAAPRPVRAPRARLASIALGWTVIGLVAAFALLMTASPLVGYRAFTVASGSMEPALNVGAVVVDEVISPSDARVGDVLTFVDPENKDRLLSHRLRRMTVRSGTAYMVTRGDQNDTSEHWRIPLDGSLGRVVYQIPKLGYARAWISGPAPLFAAFVGLIVLAGWVLVDIWRPAPQATENSKKRPDGAPKRTGGG